MKIKIKRNIKINIVHFAIIILLATILLSGQTILIKGSNLKIELLFALTIVFASMKKVKLSTNNAIKYSMVFFLIWIIISVIYAYDKSLAIHSAIMYTCLIGLICFEYSDGIIDGFLKISSMYCFVVAISILLSAFYHNLAIDLFRFWIFTPSVTASEIAAGQYSGLAGEKAEAAFLLNIGFALKVSDMMAYSNFSLKNIKNDVILIMYILAMALTGKRMLLVIPIVMICSLTLLSGVKNKFIKIFSIVSMGAMAFLVALYIIPSVSIIIERIIEGRGDTTISGRAIFWNFCKMMYRTKPLTGWGINSFNSYFADSGYKIAGGIWNYYAHSIYYEMLAEIGVNGIILFAIMVIVIYKQLWDIKKREKYCTQKMLRYSYFAFYIVSMTLIYGITGNVLYYFHQFAWFVLAGMLIIKVKKSIEVQKKKEINDGKAKQHIICNSSL